MPEPGFFKWILVSAADAVVANPNDIKKLLSMLLKVKECFVMVQ